MDFNKIFSGMKNYTVIRLPEKYPNMSEKDIDILCINADYVAKYLRKVIPRSFGFVRKMGQKGNIHIDIYDNDDFIIKFDLSDSLNNLYPEYNVPDGYLREVINNSIHYNGVMVPRLEHELSLRWLEYDKYKEERPDKIKHLHYINKHKGIEFMRFRRIR